MLSNAPRILVVDDDPQMRDLIKDYLIDSHFRVSTAHDGASMHLALAEHVVDLVLLDLQLGAEDGLRLGHRLRGETNLPVIIVSARHEEADRVMALEMAADDYITKPFNFRELLARVRAVLRRSRARTVAQESDLGAPCRGYRFSGWELNALTRQLKDQLGKPVELSNGEFRLLLAFCQSPQRVLSREQLLRQSRLYDDEIDDRSVRVQIFRLRRKFAEADPELDFIRTERGVGYIFVPHVERVA